MELIETLYRAFSDVPKPEILEGCDHCMSKEDRQLLLTDDLRNTDPDLLWNFIDDAIWTVGNKFDFKYFLPRLLDLGLTVYDINNLTGGFIAFPETLGKKLALADFDDWDREKREVVDDAIFAIMSEEARRQNFYSFEGWMCAICNIDIDKTRYLEFLDSEKGVEARDDFFIAHRDDYEHKRMEGPFWDELGVEKTQFIYDWLLERKTESDIALSRHRKSCR